MKPFHHYIYAYVFVSKSFMEESKTLFVFDYFRMNTAG